MNLDINDVHNGKSQYVKSFPFAEDIESFFLCHQSQIMDNIIHFIEFEDLL